MNVREGAGMASGYDAEMRQWAEGARGAGGPASERFRRYRRVLDTLGARPEARRLLARLSYLRVVAPPDLPGGTGETHRR